MSVGTTTEDGRERREMLLGDKDTAPVEVPGDRLRALIEAERERNRLREALLALRALTDRPWGEVDPDEHIAIVDAALYPEGH